MYSLIAAMFPEIITKIVRNNTVTVIVIIIIINESENARAISKSYIFTMYYL